jgi:hypothetical protein
VPTLAREILSSKADDEPRLKGLAVGDGCVGTDVICGDHHGPLFTVQFLHGHQQFSESLYAQITSECDRAELADGVRSDTCKRLLDRMDEEVGGYFA